jgi:hypothetical protein
MDFTLKLGSSLIVAGPTMAGKSTFVHALLSDPDMFDEAPTSVYWFHGQAEALGNNKYIVHEGLPDTFDDIPEKSVIVLDDLMQEAQSHVGVSRLFTKLVHHRRLFVINITQNFFLNSKETRTRRLNTQYIALFKNPSDVTQIHVIGRQMFPHKPSFLPSVYADATSRPHGYIFIDLRQETEDSNRVRSRILKSEAPMEIYKHN